MRTKGIAGLVITTAVLTGCASSSDTSARAPHLQSGQPGAASPAQADWIQPVQAVQRAADAAPGGVTGVFAMRVTTTGTQDGMTYLNSEQDYRDQRNLTIALPPAVVRQLESRLGADVRTALQGRQILVRGEAKRVRINFIANGRPTDKYYYQTHVRVTDAGQIQLQGEG